MARTRNELSRQNKYYIPKHRYLELKHYCLQYPEWKEEYCRLQSCINSGLIVGEKVDSSNISDMTADLAIKLDHLGKDIDLIERIVKQTDDEIDYYLLKAVTEELSFTQLKMMLNIPCGKDMYYDRYRRFYWLLDLAR